MNPPRGQPLSHILPKLMRGMSEDVWSRRTRSPDLDEPSPADGANLRPDRPSPSRGDRGGSVPARGSLARIDTTSHRVRRERSNLARRADAARDDWASAARARPRDLRARTPAALG